MAKTHVWSESHRVPVKLFGLVESSGDPEGHPGVEVGLVVVGTNQCRLFELEIGNRVVRSKSMSHLDTTPSKMQKC